MRIMMTAGVYFSLISACISLHYSSSCIYLFMLSIIAFVDNGSVESLWDVKTKRELEEFCEDEGWAVVDVKKTGMKSNSKNET